MSKRDFLYEVFMEPLPGGPRLGRLAVRSWSWRKLDLEGLVSVRGTIHPDMGSAFGAAIAYRSRGGGGIVRVNLDAAVPANAPDMRDLIREEFEAEQIFLSLFG